MPPNLPRQRRVTDVATAPILLGAGERLFDDLDGGPEGYECTAFVSSPKVTHARLTKTS